MMRSSGGSFRIVEAASSRASTDRIPGPWLRELLVEFRLAAPRLGELPWSAAIRASRAAAAAAEMPVGGAGTAAGAPGSDRAGGTSPVFGK